MEQNIEINFRSANIQSRIPEGSSINGDYKCSTGLLVEGELKGGSYTVTNGPMVVMESGRISGRLNVRGDLYVLGVVECENGIVEGTVHLGATGKMYGSLKADSYKVHAGSVLRGSFGPRH